MSPPKKYSDKLMEMRADLVDRGLNYLAVAVLIGTIFSLARIIITGWVNVYSYHLFVTFVIVILSIFKARFSYKAKIITLLAICWSAGLAGIYEFGLTGAGFSLLLLSILFTSMSYGARAGLISYAFSFAYCIIIAFLVHYGIINSESTGDPNSSSLTMWLNRIATFYVFTPVIILGFDHMQKKLLEMYIELDDKQQKHSRLVNNMIGTFFYRHGIDGVFLYVSESMTEILGYSKEEFLRHFAEYLTDNPVNDIACEKTEQCISGKQTGVYEIETYHKNGTKRWLRVSETPVRDDDNNIVAIEGVAHDVTKSKIDAEKVIQLSSSLSCIINSITSAIIAVDSNDSITQINNFAESYFEVKRQNCIGQHLTHVIPRLEMILPYFNEVTQEAIPFAISRHENASKGKIVYENIIIYPMGATASGVVIRIDDVSKEVQTESMMVQTEKMSSVAGLAAGMAHEINNPLAIITQSIQNIQRRLDPSLEKNNDVSAKYGIDLCRLRLFMDEQKITLFLGNCQNAVTRSAGIVKNMLKFSRKSDSKQVLVDIRQLLDNAIELGASDYDMKKKYDFKFVDIIREYESELPSVKCCANELEQVFLNLFKNALQAMESVTADQYKPQFHLRIKRKNSFLRIEFEDNGPGMSTEIKDRIFEPFFTTKAEGEGTGLGLSVSYSIITHNHGGSFEVLSKIGKGTMFIIHLPLR